jgi:hypothetical protein
MLEATAIVYLSTEEGKVSITDTIARRRATKEFTAYKATRERTVTRATATRNISFSVLLYSSTEEGTLFPPSLKREFSVVDGI